jgi:hypothetical protein
MLPFQLVLRKTAERSSGKQNGSALEIRFDAAMIFARADFVNVLRASHRAGQWLGASPVRSGLSRYTVVNSGVLAR